MRFSLDVFFSSAQSDWSAGPDQAGADQGPDQAGADQADPDQGPDQADGPVAA